MTNMQNICDQIEYNQYELTRVYANCYVYVHNKDREIFERIINHMYYLLIKN